MSDDIDAMNLVKPFALEPQADAAGLEPDDVQDLSFDYVRRRARTDVDLERAIKEGAYRSGVGRWTIVGVLGLELRDALLDSEGNGNRRSH